LAAGACGSGQSVPPQAAPRRSEAPGIPRARPGVRAARREARLSHKPHNSSRSVVARAALDRLVERYEQALQAAGRTVIPEDRPDLLSDLRHDREVRRQLNLAWLPYTPQGFLRILLSRPDRLRAAAPRSI